MAKIKAFNALRYTNKAGDIEKLVCPPYDIISDDERKEFLNTNEHNVIRLELPKEGADPYADAGGVLRKWMSDGILKKDDKESIYIYEEEFTVRSVTRKVKGFICLVKLEEFSKGVVLPHEETLSKAKQDRFNLMSTTFCNFSQIYSLYMDKTKTVPNKIDELSSGNADIEFTDKENITHRLWQVSEPDAVNVIVNGIADEKLYIADGHHRYETALNFKKDMIEKGLIVSDEDNGNYVMMMLVEMDNDGLVVFPTYRLVRDLDNFDEHKAVDAMKKYFDIEERSDLSNMELLLEANADDKVFGFYTGESYWYYLKLKDTDAVKNKIPGMSEAYTNLDVSILHTLILEEIFGIDKENMAKQINLTYTKVYDEALECVKSGKFQCSFILNSTKVEEIKDVALAGEKMPQKSTYFYPKLITGLVMNNFKDLD